MTVRHAIVALALCTLVATPAQAGHDHPEVFEVLWAVPGSEVAAHAHADHARSVALRPGVLAQSRFTLELWEGETVSATRTRRVVRPGGSHTWVGEVDGFPGSHVSLTFHRGRIAGSIFFGERQFEVLSNPHGSYFFEVDTHKLPPTPAPIDPGVEDGDGVAPPSSLASWTQDVLVLYTPASRARYGPAGIEAMILDAVASANQAYQNSVIDMQLSAVHIAELNYAETGDISVTLERLQRTSDGWMDEVHALRDQVGADLVALISEDTNYCGIAYVMQSESTSFASWAFSTRATPTTAPTRASGAPSRTPTPTAAARRTAPASGPSCPTAAAARAASSNSRTRTSPGTASPPASTTRWIRRTRRTTRVP
jgi:hypothetical protein